MIFALFSGFQVNSEVNATRRDARDDDGIDDPGPRSPDLMGQPQPHGGGVLGVAAREARFRHARQMVDLVGARQHIESFQVGVEDLRDQADGDEAAEDFPVPQPQSKGQDDNAEECSAEIGDGLEKKRETVRPDGRDPIHLEKKIVHECGILFKVGACEKHQNEEKIYFQKSQTDKARLRALKDEDIDFSETPELRREQVAAARLRFKFEDVREGRLTSFGLPKHRP